MSEHPDLTPDERADVVAFKRTQHVASMICLSYQPEAGGCACATLEDCRQYTDWWGEAEAIIREVRNEALEDVAEMVALGVPDDPEERDEEQADMADLAEMIRDMKDEPPAEAGAP